jgi:hypothetical protein
MTRDTTSGKANGGLRRVLNQTEGQPRRGWRHSPSAMRESHDTDGRAGRASLHTSNMR